MPYENLPRLERIGNHTRLIVEEKPFLCIGGELHNSSASDRSHMSPIWDKVAKTGINTVIAPVTWEQIEPVEGQLDLSIVDGLVEDARSTGVRLVMIWFGAFKNAFSTYAPSWVRADRDRFPRADRGAKPLKTPFSYPGSMPRPSLSVFSRDLFEADRTAYTALLRHVALIDPDHTVIMVQVENEVGLLGAGRDHSALAEAAWNAPLPEQLMTAVSEAPDSFDPELVQALGANPDSSRTWADHFGDDNPIAEETFMAWGFASFVGGLAAAGKEVLPLPAYANAWIGPQRGQDLPGQYPSGGPTARMVPVWRAAAPAIDFLAPDIYVPNSAEVMRQYATDSNPLFIPEARFRAGDAFLAIGGFRGLGYNVFGVEEGREGNQFSTACSIITSLTPEIVDGQRDGRIFGFALDPDEESIRADLMDTGITVRNSRKLLEGMLLDAGVRVPPAPELLEETVAATHGPTPGDARPFGMVLAINPTEFIVVGQGAQVDFHKPGCDVELDSVRELLVTDAGLQEGRFLNGDERLEILSDKHISAVRVRLLVSAVS
ncbi:DUF5597 domain-containing protein [Pseudarthrobacter sp. R1]|uniref:DUF5597 domain-containing protein n=1 Tax=Pseudarthrobacter sp. R1 TaxID=2944934 RepID=UPI00210CA51F|nr:DUF5597 domain-containing protein [Pseudarthrobacter sp. R1]MCQ6271467.1 DUF5597 domain-containing protein [Pseudarthrobacter sp. R1]